MDPDATAARSWIPNRISLDRRRDPVRGAARALGVVLLVACGERAEAPPPAVGRADSPTTSRLWGANGELWRPDGRLPDFSFAGYHAGEREIPEVEVTANVREFGARGDGEADDTEAFLAALAAAPPGAILVPPGRYKITQPLRFIRSGIVLRGAGRDATVLTFPRTLFEVVGPGKDGGPHGWAWGGAWLWVNGDPATGDSSRIVWQEGRRLATLVRPAPRGERRLEVDDASGIRPGQWIRLVEQETDGSLSLELHAGQRLGGRCQVDRPGNLLLNWAVEVAAVEGSTVELVRPLRVPLAPQWHAALWSFEPPVEEVGIEHLTVEFPPLPMPEHHAEPGQNAISLAAAYNSWVRDVAIVNFDNALMFWYSKHCTAEDIVLAGRAGHYGINLAGSQDSRVSRFRIDNGSLHDLSVANLGNGNVVSWGEGCAINFDHHRYAPYENLFSAIDVGEAALKRRLWRSSGTPSGHYTAARETFWNVSSAIDGAELPVWPAMNVIGAVRRRPNPEALAVDAWVEAIAAVEPPELHAAQRARRLGRALLPPPDLPAPVPEVPRCAAPYRRPKEDLP